MTKKKLQRRFVPRMILTAACAATVVPVCAIEACGGETRGHSSDAGAGGQSFGVAIALGGNGGLRGVAAGGFGAGGGPSVAAAGFGGFGVGAAFGGAGGLPFVAAAGFGGAGGVAAGGFGGFTVAAAFGGNGGFQVAGGAFGVASGGFGGAIRDSGSDAKTNDASASDAAKGGHASRDPDEGAFGELGSGAESRNGRTRTSKRRRS